MSAALWLAAGTAAGVVVGVTLADRGGGGKKLLGRLKGALQLLDAWTQRSAGDGPRATGSERTRFTDVPADDDDYADGDDTEFSPEYDTGGYDPDAEEGHVDERVLAAFEQDPILSERDIEIDEPEPAVIALSGRVATQEDAKHAVTIARGVPGVERVDNSIRVTE